MQGLLIIDSDQIALLIEYLNVCVPKLKSQPITVVVLDSSPEMRNFIRRDFTEWSGHLLFVDYTASLLSTVESLSLTLSEYRIMLFSQSDRKIEEAKQLSWDNLYLPKQGELYQKHVDDFTKKCDASIAEMTGKKPTVVLALDIDDTTVFLQRSLRARSIVLNSHILLFVRNFFERYHTRANISVVFITARNAQTEAQHEQREKNAKTPKELAAIRSYFLSVKRVVAAFLAELTGLLSPDQIAVYFNQEKFSQLTALCGPDTLGVMLDDNRVWLAPFEYASPAVREKITFISVHAEKNYLPVLNEEISAPISSFEHHKVMDWYRAVVSSVADNASAFLPAQRARVLHGERALVPVPNEPYPEKESQDCGCVVA